MSKIFNIDKSVRVVYTACITSMFESSLGSSSSIYAYMWESAPSTVSIEFLSGMSSAMYLIV